MTILRAPFREFTNEVLEALNNRYITNGHCVFNLPCGKYAVAHIYPRTVFAICDTTEEIIEAMITAPKPEIPISTPARLPKDVPFIDLTDFDLGI